MKITCSQKGLCGTKSEVPDVPPDGRWTNQAISTLASIERTPPKRFPSGFPLKAANQVSIHPPPKKKEKEKRLQKKKTQKKRHRHPQVNHVSFPDFTSRALHKPRALARLGDHVLAIHGDGRVPGRPKGGVQHLKRAGRGGGFWLREPARTPPGTSLEGSRL